MTEESKKENLSSRTIEAFANNLGYDVETVKKDYGVDVRIIEYTVRTLPTGKKHYLPSNRELKIQLKATTENSINRTKGIIKYNLRSKNYNDMVDHQNWQRPTYLFLVVLPENELNWFHYDTDELILRNQCYWYIHPPGTTLTKNTSSNIIDIPIHQILDQNTISHLLDETYK
jgi:hypothetical protein